MKTRLTFVILLLLGIASVISCGRKSASAGRKGLIPEKNLISLLSDLYIGDGLLQYSPVRNMFTAKDTISSYIDVIKKHGYTKEQVDRTLQYYFVNDPKELQKIYDEVLADLSAIQSGNETAKVVAVRTNELWNQKTSFSLPEEGKNNPLYFTLPISDTGWFYLSLNAIVYKNDGSLNPRITVFFWKMDREGRQEKQMWSKSILLKDDLEHSYTVTGRLSDTSFKNIGGYLMDCDMQKIGWEKHARLTEIKLLKGVPE